MTFVLVHDTHGHAEEAKTGCTGTLQTLADDASHGGYLAGGISVTYTDNGANGQPALTTTDQHVVQLKRQQVEYAQEQSGTDDRRRRRRARSGRRPGPHQPRSGRLDRDQQHVNLTNMDKQITFRFAGGAAPRAAPPRRRSSSALDSPTGPLADDGHAATDRRNNNTYTNQTFPLDFTGSQALYLVFRAIDGRARRPGFGNLNWVEFTGPGTGCRPRHSGTRWAPPPRGAHPLTRSVYESLPPLTRSATRPTTTRRASSAGEARWALPSTTARVANAMHAARGGSGHSPGPGPSRAVVSCLAAGIAALVVAGTAFAATTQRGRRRSTPWRRSTRRAIRAGARTS